MKSISFFKYTSYGNNFVIVDETLRPLLNETEKQNFAYQATNIYFGIGSDNFLVIQPCNLDVLKEINDEHHYWKKLPDPTKADYIFRMFEPSGDEAFSCGNGLICIANHLYHKYGLKSTRIMTEIPTSKPKVVSIGTNAQRETNWANMGQPRRIPSVMVDRSMTLPYDPRIDIIKDIEISNFRQSDGFRFFTNESSLTITGYLVFTGEPHFVIFTDSGFSLKEPAGNIFISSWQRKSAPENAEKRMSTSSALVHFIGRYFDRVYSNLFPTGININFVRISNNAQTLEYRCFERGIKRETLACGTGALASAYIARKLNLVESKKISVWPHRCRWHKPDAQIQVEERKNGWILHGNPVMLFEGDFKLDEPQLERSMLFRLTENIPQKEIFSDEGVPYVSQNVHF